MSIASKLLKSNITSFTVTLTDGEETTCYQKDLSAGAVLDFVSIEEGPDRNAALLNLVAKAICEEDGSPVFSPKDTSELSNMPVKIFEQLSNAVVENAGLSEAQAEEGNS